MWLFWRAVGAGHNTPPVVDASLAAESLHFTRPQAADWFWTLVDGNGAAPAGETVAQKNTGSFYSNEPSKNIFYTIGIVLSWAVLVLLF